MKTLKYITLVLAGLLLFSCEVDYYSDPNQPEVAPTYGIMNRVQKRIIDDTRDEWFSGRQSLLWVQYWNQVNYTEEDRFQYRETVNQGAWDDLYKNAQDLIDLINLNTDEATKGDMAKYGPNVNQIAAARIMLVYVYQRAVELWGDVPYWSYESENPDFQANSLKTDGIDQPVYASQEDIYIDMLESLDEAQAAIDVDKKMIDGDNLFAGDAAQWKKFANSLRLRIANRVKGVYSGASAHITGAISAGVMESNADNAGLTYESSALNGAPMYRAFVVSARKDFAPSASFVDLLKGERGPFGVVDPRLDIYVADNENGDKVGIPLTGNNEEVKAFLFESMPGDAVLAPNYTEMYMEYSEVCFIMSEHNGWDQDWYEAGVSASMEKWGVAEADIADYIDALPAASEETVMMQKYIALYMQPMEAWSEYRRTGYPNTLVKPNTPYDYTYPTPKGEVTGTFEFKPIGGLTDLPTRNKYLLNEYSINAANVEAAATAIGGDEQTTPLWWME